jgi:hypothetical protein
MTEKRTPDEQFEAHTRAVFESSVESLDGRTRSKLTQARHAALRELQHARPSWMRWWMPVSGLATGAILVMWIGFGRVGLSNPEPGELPLDDFEIVGENANLELLEDVEFYAWIARQPSVDGSDHRG